MSGIRNAIISNFNPIKLRLDVGELWENYLASERVKLQTYKNIPVNNFFWRTYDQQELDWVEEETGQLRGYEFKWSSNKKPKVPAAWKRAYPKAEYHIVNPTNYLSWILSPNKFMG